MREDTPRHVWLNGDVVPVEEASVPIMDRGFLYGDGVFESMLVRGEDVPLLSYHLDRLSQNCHRIGIDFPGEQTLKQAVQTLVEDHFDQRNTQAVLKILVTAGKGEGLHRDEDAPSNVVIMPRKLSKNSQEMRQEGFDAVLKESVGYTGRPLANIKTLSRLEQSLYLESVKQEAEDRVLEPLIVSGEGKLLEGATKNIFLRNNDTWYTPRSSDGVLPGVCRRVLLEHVSDCQETSLFVQDLLRASHAVFTSSSVGPVPIRTIHTFRLGDDQDAPISFPSLPDDHQLFQCWDQQTT